MMAVIKYRATTVDGQTHELEAEGIRAALASLWKSGYPLSKVTSMWHYNTQYRQWFTSDSLLREVKAQAARPKSRASR